MADQSHCDISVKARIQAELVRIAKSGRQVTYHELAVAAGLSPPASIHKLTVVLEELMAEDAEVGRPFLASFVISKVRTSLPAKGFFDHAALLGRLKPAATDAEAIDFYCNELSSAREHWGD